MGALRATMLMAFASAALLQPCSALAGTLSFNFVRDTATYTAAAGETNNVAVTGTTPAYQDFVLTISDNYPITLAETPPSYYPCSGAGTTLVQCHMYYYRTAALLSLGDMNDYFALNGGIGVAVDAGIGNDTLNAGNGGYDTLNGGPGNDTLNGGDGGDALNGDAGDDALTGGPGNDSLNGGAGIDSLLAGTGDDTLIGGSDPDTLDGGDGFDTVDYTGNSFDQGGGIYGVNVTYDGLANDGNLVNDSPWPFVILEGRDNVAGTIEKVIGTDGQDTITEPNCTGLFCIVVDRTFIGGAENDVLTGGVGNDTLDGGAGDDTVSGGVGADTLTGGPGDDAIAGGGETDTFQEGDQNRVTAATMMLTNTSLTGSFGTDSLSSIETATLRGGNGNDTIDASAATIPVTLWGGIDATNLGNGNDTLVGGSANDNLYGGSSGDPMYLDSDTLTGGPGSNVLKGGTFNGPDEGGNDRVLESGGSFTLTNSALTGFRTDSLTAIDSATLTGSGGSDTIDGSAFTHPQTLNGSGGTDALISGSSADKLDGGGGLDTLQSGGSDDALTGGTEDDTLDGGAGIDTLVESADVNLSLTNVSLTGLGTDSLISIDRATLTGGGGDNTINGSGFSGPETFDGVAGNDVLTGGAGGSTLTGGVGNDSLNGGVNTDTLNGGAGDDTLAGNGGSDALNGGDNNDTLTGGPGNDALAGGNDTDRVVESGGSFTLQNASLTGSSFDTLASIETATLTGGATEDALNASAFTLGPVLLNGLAGIDQLLGGSQGDTLNGGAGADTYDAGAGDDTVQARDLEHDTVGCGAGTADSAVVDAVDDVNADCELKDLDVTAPETTINSGPSGTVTATSASFEFTSSEPGSTFTCALDGGAFAACSSPAGYSGLGAGGHSFQVRAHDSSGNIDPSPASRTWTISAPPPPPPPPPPVLTPPKCVVPKVIGKPLARAKALIVKAHCRVGKVTKRRSKVKKNLVVGESPKPGTKLKNGAKVNLVVSKGR